MAVSVVRGPDSATLAPAEVQDSATASNVKAGDASRFYLPEAGVRYSYLFDRRITFQGELAGAKLPEAAYGGEFYVDVLRADGRAFEAVVSEKLNGMAPSPLARVEVDARGDRLSLFTSPDATAEEQEHLSVLKDLLCLWLFPLRADTVGTFEARFDRLPGGDDRKAKLGYLAKGTGVPELLESEHRLRWDDSLKLPRELRGREVTRLGRGSSALTALSRYALKFTGKGAMPAHSRSLLASLHAEAGLELQKKGDLSQHPDHAKLDWNTLLAQLRGLEKLDGGKQLELFGDLLNYLRLHPGKLSELTALLRDPALLRLGIHSALFKTLVGTLATLGTPEALAALRDAYDDPALGKDGKGTILAALTTTQVPIDATTRDFLADKMASERDRQLANGAAFALGSALQNAGSDSQAAKAISQIGAAWNAAATPGDQLALLDVMGNSGRTEFFATLQGVLASEADSAIRARAAYSLRFVPADSATQELVLRLTDRDARVRESAAAAIDLAPWKEAFRAPLEACSGGETAARVQDICRKVLGENGAVASN